MNPDTFPSRPVWSHTPTSLTIPRTAESCLEQHRNTIGKGLRLQVFEDYVSVSKMTAVCLSLDVVDRNVKRRSDRMCLDPLTACKQRRTRR